MAPGRICAVSEWRAGLRHPSRGSCRQPTTWRGLGILCPELGRGLGAAAPRRLYDPGLGRSPGWHVPTLSALELPRPAGPGLRRATPGAVHGLRPGRDAPVRGPDRRLPGTGTRQSLVAPGPGPARRAPARILYPPVRLGQLAHGLIPVTRTGFCRVHRMYCTQASGATGGSAERSAAPAASAIPRVISHWALIRLITRSQAASSSLLLAGACESRAW